MEENVIEVAIIVSTWEALVRSLTSHRSPNPHFAHVSFLDSSTPIAFSMGLFLDNVLWREEDAKIIQLRNVCMKWKDISKQLLRS